MAVASEFAVQLSTNAAVSLQWYCRTHEVCTYTAPSMASSCVNSIFEDISELEAQFSDLPNACHEVLLQDGQSLLDDGLCADMAACAAVLYRINTGRNRRATCPSGTEMVMLASGLPEEDVYYRFLPDSQDIQLIGGGAAIGNNCTALEGSSDGYECASGSVEMRFTQDSAVCDSSSGNACPTPRIGSTFGFCGGECRGIPEGPDANVFETDFQVRLTVTNDNANPSLQWQCLSTPTCSSTPPSLECLPSSFLSPSHLDEFSSRLSATGGNTCEEISIDDDTFSCTPDKADGSTCSTVRYRYTSGRNQVAICPGGTEMVMLVSGLPLQGIDYIFTIPDNVHVIGGMPDDCRFIFGQYRCPTGSLKLRLSLRGTLFCDSTDASVACRKPTSGTLRGLCSANSGSDPTCVGPPDPPVAPVGATVDFGVRLAVSNNNNDLAPSLDWHCRSSTTCTYTTTPSIADTCRKSIFRDQTEMDVRISQLHGSECNEVVIENQEAGCESCPAVFYRKNDGRNVVATCPAGTELVMTVSGIPNAGIDYYIKPTQDWVQMNSDVPDQCTFIDGNFRCASGKLTMRFSLRGALACDVEEGNCPDEPVAGDAYGTCLESETCDAGPPPQDAPPGTSEFGVRVFASNSNNDLAPVLQWHCRSAALCTYFPASLSGDCAESFFEGNADFERHQLNLGDGCQQIIIQDGSQVLDGSCGTKQCPATFFRYKDGRSQTAVCPAGTELVLTTAGIPSTSMEYVFVPTVAGTMLNTELPEGCIWANNAYRCSSGVIELRFSLRGDGVACDSTSLSTCPAAPSTGIPYGFCSATPVCSTGRQIEDPALTAEFAVRLFATSSSSSLIPSLGWHCKVDDFCFASPASIASSCEISSFNTTSELEESYESLSAACNRILVTNGAGIADNSCTREEDESCVGLTHRYKDGRSRDAVCPTGTQMVLTVSGIPSTSQEYVFRSNPEARMQEMPEDCVHISNLIRCPSGVATLTFEHGGRPACLGNNCLPPDSGFVYGQCRNGTETVCLAEFPSVNLEPFDDTFEPTVLPTEMPATWPPTFGRQENALGEPTALPTSAPTPKPTSMPTSMPTSKPTSMPTSTPTFDPTSMPTSKPTSGPTSTPTSMPTSGPTSMPTSMPTSAPTSSPTSMPTATPSALPSLFPSVTPSSQPSRVPTGSPSAPPTIAPTVLPIFQSKQAPSLATSSSWTSSLAWVVALVLSVRLLF